MPRFMLEGPRPRTIQLLLCVYTPCLNYVIKTFLFVSSSVSSEQLLFFVHGQGQTREQKHTTKNFVDFNHLPRLTISRF